jgi:glycerophosphoryl diester phosphodiesterase
METVQKPYVCGHRGASRAFPENSAKAIEAALSMGANSIEIKY